MPAGQPRPGQRADWRSDPEDPALIRYWEGDRWSVYTLPKPSGWDAHPALGRPWWQRGWFLAPAISVLVITMFAAIGGGSGTDPGSDAAAPTPSATSSTTESPEPTPVVQVKAPKPVKAEVPRVVGLSRDRATRRLEAVGLTVVVARSIPSPRPVGTVLRQLTAAGSKVRPGSRVSLVVATPYPAVPRVVGLLQAGATQRLRSAGFRVAVTQEVVTSGRTGEVLRQTPRGAVRVQPHSVVTLVVANVVRPVAPPPASCTPGYRPCLTPASDYDCAGGSGDGPKYAYGPVYVTGYDIYDLDRDGDGVACES